MSVALKIYRSNLINDILLCTCYEEVKALINENIEKLRLLPVSREDLTNYITATLAELKALNQSPLGYGQYANIITAKVHLKALNNGIPGAVS